MTNTPAPEHSAGMVEIYQRMLRRSGAHGRFVTLRTGQRVHVIEGGAGPPVVHLHGNNTSALSHLMLLEHTTSVRSYLVDRPGMGLSDPSGFPRRQFRQVAVQFVDDVLDALELETAVLAGASGGGVYATWYSLEHPQRVRGLVLLGSTPTLPGGRVPPPIRMMATPGLGEALTRALRPGRRMLVRMMASMGESDTITHYPDLLDSLVEAAKDNLAATANRAELRALISPIGFRPTAVTGSDELRRLAVPTLMIWGDRDPVVSTAHARAASQQIPDARLEVLSAGHVPQLGHPQRVGELLNTFVLRLPS